MADVTGDEGGAEVDPADVALLADLRAFHEATDPVPAGLAEQLLIEMTVEFLHAEIAELTSPTLVAAREEEPTRTDTVTFGGETGSLMVSDFGEATGSLALDGWVAPGGATVEIHCGAVVRRVVSESTGRFVVTDLPRGPVWFVVFPAGPDGGVRPLVTPSVEL